jgi:hypothetical protein
MGQSKFLNSGFGDDHHPRIAGTVGNRTGYGAKAKALKN